MSRTPIAVMRLSKRFGCRTLSTSRVFVIVRTVRAMIENPTRVRKPPKAIFNRCLEVKCGMCFRVGNGQY